jgi:hypothetical protein
MKVRNGFVSNSLSSTYVSDISGDAEEIYDDDFSEAEWVQCPAGHVFEQKYVLNFKDYKRKADLSEDYSIRANQCPICLLVEIPNKVVLEYLFLTGRLDIEMVKDEIRTTHTDYVAFMETMKDLRKRAEGEKHGAEKDEEDKEST